MAGLAGLLDERDLIALRRAAAMAHAVNGLTVTLRSHGDLVARIEPWAQPDAQRPAPVFGPCGFRKAVAEAWDDHRAGRKVCLTGLGNHGLDVDWSVRPPGVLVGFGAVRVQCAGTWSWALASLLDPAELSCVLDEAGEATRIAPPDIDLLDARTVYDARLDVSVVCVEARPGDAWKVALLDEVMRRLVAATTAAELLVPLAPA